MITQKNGTYLLIGLLLTVGIFSLFSVSSRNKGDQCDSKALQYANASLYYVTFIYVVGLYEQMIGNKDFKEEKDCSGLESRYYTAMEGKLTNDPGQFAMNCHFELMRTLAEESLVVTEMGVRSGISTIAWLMGRPQKLISYDLYKQEPEIPLIENLNKECGVTNFTFVVADVLKVDIETTDVLFIDTWHAYAQLSKELKKHGPKARKYIVFHDTVLFSTTDESAVYLKDQVINPELKGLNLAIREFQLTNPEWKTKRTNKNCNGMTVLQKSFQF